MVNMTLEVPDDLAERIRPLQAWLTTILELSLIGCQTGAAATATEVIQFLSQNPTPETLLQFHASARSQEHLQRLLSLSQADLLSPDEERELDELQQIEHILILLKARVYEHSSQEA